MRGLNRTIGWGVVFATVLVLTGCSSGAPSVATVPTTAAAGIVRSSVSPSAGGASFPIPNGTYKTTATRREALAKGFTTKEIDRYYGPDGKLPYSLVFDNGSYHDIVESDSGLEEVGDLGTYTAAERVLVMTSKSSGCPGCVYTWRWSFDGKVLSLKLLSGSEGPADLRNVRLVAEHDYMKVG
jgi:hypothetical protein